jgi:FkbM family methyltransferase
MYFHGPFVARLNGRSIAKLLHKGHQIENEIYWRGFDGCLEKESIKIFARIMKALQPKVVWDIGANSGTYGILAKALHPKCHVIFFEPLPAAVAMIRENVRLNHFDAQVFEMALGDYDGTGKIYLERGKDMAYSVTVNSNTLAPGTPSDTLIIDVKRADSAIEKFEIPTPDLVKLDVEGFEYEVLKGFGNTNLKKCIFLIEILSDELATKLADFFPKSEFSFWNLDDANSRAIPTEVLGKSYFYNYLIVPKCISQKVFI